MAVIGADLGTTNSLASAWTEKGLVLISNAFGEHLTLSVISFGKDGEVYVGKVAKEMQVTNPMATFAEFKRNMGQNVGYKVPWLMGRVYRPEELSALIIRQLKDDAERFLGETVTEAIISVPAYFNDNQRCATRDAGKLAGINVLRLIDEPSAAALSNRLSDEEDTGQTYVVFDLGGGTLDISVVDSFENIVDIQAVAGDNRLGGKDFNEVIADYLVP